ncbi:hypothetical protein E1A91_D10G087000v1 [Gossypium mustelinum]|uniref:Uncharacterized protein n=1 Tax=Gossypium mustelinum TaxID=34275 RepID=A0A5D2T7Q8_GOSMU|nr:hypothetical protein E1A91_D10G087000v1 [Gossypium mustelinum]
MMEIRPKMISGLQLNFSGMPSDPMKSSRCFEASTMTFSNEDQVLLVVKETPVVNAGICVASPGSVTKDANSGSTIIQASTNTLDQFLFHPMSSTLYY